MSYDEKLESVILDALKQGKLLDIAAYAIRAGLEDGYCEFTEHKELWDLVEKYHCPFCGRQHRSRFHDELNKFFCDDAVYDSAKNRYCVDNPGAGCRFISTTRLIPYFPGFDTSLTADKPQEYTPE